MSISFRTGFYAGLGFACVLGVYLVWLWLPEHQVRRHTENFLHAIEQKDWARMAEFLSSNYHDQWGHDRTQVLERAREVFRFLRDLGIHSSRVIVTIDGRNGCWKGKIDISAEEGEFSAAIKERVNSLTERFILEWQRASAKPWDWKLIRVSNPGLEIPEEGY